MNEYTYNLTLRVSHPSHDPLEWIEKMPFNPMVYWKLGENEITNVKKGTFSREITNKDNYCCFEVELLSSGLLSEGLMAFVNKIQLMQEYFQGIVNTGGTVSLSVGWYINSNATEEVSWKILEKLSHCKINLLLDAYTECD